MNESPWLNDIKKEMSDGKYFEIQEIHEQDYNELKNICQFEIELTNLINRFSLEKYSNTPDHVLAGYLMTCLENWNITCQIKKAYEV